MRGELVAKTEQYERALDEAIHAAVVVPPEGSPLRVAADEVFEMAEAYYDDGCHFLGEEDYPNALAAFAYGHGWLDAGARVGLFEVPADGTFAV